MPPSASLHSAQSPSPSPLAAADRLRRVPSLLAADVDGEMVMMDVEKGVYYGLDAIGSDIWKRLETPISAAELAAELAKAYEADVATIEADVLVLFNRLVEQGLAEVA